MVVMFVMINPINTHTVVLLNVIIQITSYHNTFCAAQNDGNQKKKVSDTRCRVVVVVHVINSR
jgi:hypothetical protein